MPSDQKMSRMNPGSSCRKRCMIAEPASTVGWTMKRVCRRSSPGTVGKAACVGGAFRRLILEFPEGMALAADLRRAPRIEPRGMHDAGVGRLRQVQGVAAPGIGVGPDVLVGRSMTRFARDAELRRRRLHLLRRDWLRPERRVEGGPAEGRVAGDADAVPRARFRERGLSRRMHDRRAARNPAPFADQPDRRELAERPPMSGRVPIDLLIVRSRGQHHVAFYATH